MVEKCSSNFYKILSLDVTDKGGVSTITIFSCLKKSSWIYPKI